MSLRLTPSTPLLKVNWDKARMLRDIRAGELNDRHEPFPRYLLLNEVHDLLYTVEDQKRYLAMLLMFVTGARVQELVQLKPSDFRLGESISCVRLRTAKKRDHRKTKNKRHAEKLKAAGYDSADVSPSRWVPLPDEAIHKEIRSYIVTHKIKPQHRLFPVVTRTVQTWVSKAVESYNESAGHRRFDFPVSCHTFRHSFAMNACLHGVPQRVLKEWLGHQSMASTEIYLRLMQVDSYLVAEQVSWRPPVEDVTATPNETYLLGDDD